MAFDAFAPTPDDEITRYFKDLEYEVSWDFSRKIGKKWYEIMKGDEIVAQIDMGVPLEAIVEDLCCFHKNKKGTSKVPDYDICLEDTEEAKEFLAKVFACKNKAIP